MTSRKPNPGATPAERRLWGTGMVPGSVARNRRRRSSAEQVAAQRDMARRAREDDWPTGKPKPARLGDQVEVAGGMPAWVRKEPVGKKQRQRRGGKKQKKVGRPRGDGEGAKANRGAASEGADVSGDRERARTVVRNGEAGIRLMGAVVRHRAPSMSSIVRTWIRTRDFTPQLVPSTGANTGKRGKSGRNGSRHRKMGASKSGSSIPKDATNCEAPGPWANGSRGEFRADEFRASLPS
jgi:hypothetical protein